jgi:hypothetical protein
VQARDRHAGRCKHTHNSRETRKGNLGREHTRRDGAVLFEERMAIMVFNLMPVFASFEYPQSGTVPCERRSCCLGQSHVNDRGWSIAEHSIVYTYYAEYIQTQEQSDN